MRKRPVNAIPRLHCSENSKVKNGKSEKPGKWKGHRKESKRKNTRLEKSNKIKTSSTLRISREQEDNPRDQRHLLWDYSSLGTNVSSNFQLAVWSRFSF